MEHLNKQDLVEGSGQWGYALEEFFGAPVKVLMLSPLSLKVSRFLLEVILSTSHLPSLKEESQTDYELKRPRHVTIYAFLVTHSFFRYLFQRQKGNISMAVEIKCQQQLL